MQGKEVLTGQEASEGAARFTSRPGSLEAGFLCLCPYTCFGRRRSFYMEIILCVFSCCLPKQTKCLRCPGSVV